MERHIDGAIGDEYVTIELEVNVSAIKLGWDGIKSLVASQGDCEENVYTHILCIGKRTPRSTIRPRYRPINNCVGFHERLRSRFEEDRVRSFIKHWDDHVSFATCIINYF